MGMTVSDTGTFTPTPAGTHIAVCIGYVDLGTQKSNFEGKERIARKVRVMWELSEEKRDDGRPWTTGKTYTNSLGERAALRQHLEGWRGRPFTADELKGFDLDKIVGKPCLLTVTHKPKQGGGISDSITGVAPLHRSMTAPQQVTPSVIFIIDQWDQRKFDALPQFLQQWIIQSPEGMKKHTRPPSGGGHEPGAYEPDDGQGGDIPF